MPPASAKRDETGRVYWENRVESHAVNVAPGAYYVTERADLAIVTLLGSCVAACVRDVETGVGGLNHFLLPDQREDVAGGQSMRYGVYAMEVLVNDILRRGGTRCRLEAKIFGGGKVIGASAGVGDKNAKFVADYLHRERIPIAASDLGGERARRVFFFPASGRVRVLKPAPLEESNVGAIERDFQRKVKTTSGGGVELFI